MTVPNTTIRNGPYYPNGATVAFPFTFRAIEKDDVQVIRVAADGSVTYLSSALFNVTLTTNGGTATFVVPPLAGDPLYVQLDPAFSQEISFENEGAFLPEVITEALDRGAQRSLWLRERILSVVPDALASAAARAGRFLSWGPDGTPQFSSGTGNDPALRTDLGTTNGTSFLGWLRTTGATVRSLRSMLMDFSVSIKEFGAIGDGVADDTPAIQAALDYAGRNGGGTMVRVPPGNFRITKGLRLPSYVGLEGYTPSRYPYGAGNPNLSKIIADFANAFQWVIEPKIVVAGAPLPYNSIVAGNLPDETCYNCSVRDLIITSVGVLPFGGIRMAGCPGGFVDGVSIYRVGCGLLVNYGFGGEYTVHVHSAYYGVVNWGEANANKFSVYCAQIQEYIGIVPAAYRLSFIANKDFVAEYNLPAAHNGRSMGVIAGGLTSNVRIDAVIEHFSDGIVLLDTFSADLSALYIEGSTNETDFAFVSGNASWHCTSLHAFLSGTGSLYAFGKNSTGYIDHNGSAFAASFGKPPEQETVSRVRIGSLKPGFMGVVNQFNLIFPDNDGDWIAPTLAGGVGILGLPNNPFGYRITRTGKVEFRGGLTGVGTGTVPFQLPAGFRPFYTQMLDGFGGTADVRGSGGTPADSGNFVITSGGPTIIFDSVKPFDQIS